MTVTAIVVRLDLMGEVIWHGLNSCNGFVVEVWPLYFHEFRPQLH